MGTRQILRHPWKLHFQFVRLESTDGTWLIKIYIHLPGCYKKEAEPSVPSWSSPSWNPFPEHAAQLNMSKKSMGTININDARYNQTTLNWHLFLIRSSCPETTSGVSRFYVRGRLLNDQKWTCAASYTLWRWTAGLWSKFVRGRVAGSESKQTALLFAQTNASHPPGGRGHAAVAVGSTLRLSFSNCHNFLLQESRRPFHDLPDNKR